MVRDTLKEYERMRVIGSNGLEKKKKEKIEELKQKTGISMFAVSKKEIRDINLKINLDSPSKKLKTHVSMKKLTSKPEKTKQVLFQENLNSQVF